VKGVLLRVGGDSQVGGDQDMSVRSREFWLGQHYHLLDIENKATSGPKGPLSASKQTKRINTYLKSEKKNITPGPGSQSQPTGTEKRLSLLRTPIMAEALLEETR